MSSSQESRISNIQRATNDVVDEKLQAISRQLNLPFFDLLDNLIGFDVPIVALEAYGTRPQLGSSAPQTIHALGLGHSGRVVLHQTIEEITLESEVILEPGTLVALKIFKAHAGLQDSDVEREVERKVHAAIAREVEVYCHPTLRNHENICQLLFAGWERYSRFPALALELAAYGSLESVLMGPGTYLSSQQKVNLTIDITLGLLALHQCNIIHGDVKPSNIILQEHRSRQIVAKLTDFGGAGQIAQEDGRPALATEVWCAPETVYSAQSVDWRKADSYSYGLVIASMWARPEQYIKSMRSSCILEIILGLELSVEGKRDLLMLIKSQHEESPQSVISICREWIRCRDLHILATLHKIVLSTLHRDAKDRKSIGDLTRDEIPELAAHVGRSMR